MSNPYDSVLGHINSSRKARESYEDAVVKNSDYTKSYVSEVTADYLAVLVIDYLPKYNKVT